MASDHGYPMPIQQTYFELRDVSPLQGRPWIPLRQATDVSFDPPEPGILRIEEFIGIATAAVDEAKRAEAESWVGATLALIRTAAVSNAGVIGPPTSSEAGRSRLESTSSSTSTSRKNIATSGTFILI